MYLALEGPVGQVRLCDSDKDCPEGTRCKSHCNRYACVVQCIPIPDNHPVSTNQLESTGEIKTKLLFLDFLLMWISYLAILSNCIWYIAGKKCALCCILGGMNTCPIWYKLVHLCDNCLTPNNEQKEIISPKSIPGSGILK